MIRRGDEEGWGFGSLRGCARSVAVGVGWEGGEFDWSRYSTSSEPSLAVKGTALGSPKKSLMASYATNYRFVQSLVISVLSRCNFRLPEMKKN